MAASCTFFVLDADFVRTFSGNGLPFFQQIREEFPEALGEITIDYAEAVQGTHLDRILSISHRWMAANNPDPDGEQLKAIQAFLNSPAGNKIELVWIDSACMPQDQPRGSRNNEDTAAFKTMLSEVNLLYLGTTVLILLDLSYVSRFWTQFESWLAMQYAMPDGLKPAIGTQNERHHIVCIQNAAAQAELYTRALVDNWATKTPEEAFDFLSKPDVTVTNQSDKDGQLPKIKALDGTVQGAFQLIWNKHEVELAARCGSLSRAEAALDTWEKENDAVAGESNKFKLKVLQAQDAADRARVAREKHSHAIASSVVPMIMERTLTEKVDGKPPPPGAPPGGTWTTEVAMVDKDCDEQCDCCCPVYWLLCCCLFCEDHMKKARAPLLFVFRARCSVCLTSSLAIHPIAGGVAGVHRSREGTGTATGIRRRWQQDR